MPKNGARTLKMPVRSVAKMAEYIEREALRQFPIRLNHYDKEHGNEHFVLGIESVLEYAESLPKADVAKVYHGEWIMHTNSDGNLNHYECSVCHMQQGYLSNYCEDCGTKMDRKDDAE
jgi:hypothetical protein